MDDQGTRRPLVAVVGPGTATEAEERQAEAVGAGLARAGCALVCGGLGGVMAAACRGLHTVADRAPGVVAVGILPGRDPAAGNRWLDVALPSGLGEARNVLVVRAAGALVAVGGAYGTLSEIAFALKVGTAVFGLGTWELARDGVPDTGVRRVADVDDAVSLAVDAARAWAGPG